MPLQELSDEEVFGSDPSGEVFSDEQVFSDRPLPGVDIDRPTLSQAGETAESLTAKGFVRGEDGVWRMPPQGIGAGLTEAPGEPNVFNDMVLSADRGMAEGVTGLIELPSNIAGMIGGMDRTFGQAFDPSFDYREQNPAEQVSQALSPGERVNMPTYEPQTPAGEAARTAFRYALGAVLGPEAAVASATGAAGDEIAGQTAQAMGATEEQEGMARMVGGVAGGFIRPQMPRGAPPPPVTATGPNSFMMRPPPVPPKPGSIGETVQIFEDANVRPMLAATGERPARLAQFSAENPFVGGSTRANMVGAIDDAGAEAQRIAQGYGTPTGPQGAGSQVVRGVERFARDPSAPDSFRARASVMYDDAFAAIPNGPVQTPETSRVLTEALSRVGAPELARIVNNSDVERIAAALAKDAGNVSFEDLRALRTWVREQRAAPNLTGQGISNAQLTRLESALTSDINSNAAALGGPQAATRLRRADQFYGAGQRRLDDALEPFAGTNGEDAYNRIVRIASEGGSADVQQLSRLKRSLRPDEWNDVAATVVSRMGKPTPGAVGAVEEGAFSVNTFVTNYNKLSPQGRALLFGGSRNKDLMRDLDRLARAADRLKGIERMANSSNSGANIGTLVSGGGVLGGAGALVATGNPLPLAGALAWLGAIRLNGEAMTNPSVVRWLAKLTSAKTPQAFNARLATLKAEGAQSPALMALATEVERAQAEQEQPPQ